ncbi:hypothetical protein DBR32_06230 [Taibaiella sp. KBW10]|uniref:hypothetical protein n=1 Tax=Taibaiella sp. KBW10 TaxID=2153357 RepID=UPI000F5A5968|nr:hypothetical protein [Taibaiella sp. KBW10]RQO31552.1 hypothetical protein DBR32_06230 [Taibaiella sp. KBW10]
MKKIIFVLSILSLSLTGIAQSAIDAQKGLMSIPGYSGNAAVIVKRDTVKIQKDEHAKEFKLVHHGNTISLANPEDSSQVYNILDISPAQLAEALKDNAGKTTVDKLLDIAGKMRDGKLVIKKEGTLNTTDTTVEEGAQPAIAVTETQSNNWLIPAICGLAALIIGFVIGKSMSGKKELIAPVIDPIPAALPDTPAPASESVQKLKADNKELKEKNKLITEKTQALISGDELYYNQVFNKIILPLQEAIDSGNEAAIVKQLNLAAAHFSSITRTKIRKKLKYDDANIQLVTGNPSFTNEFTAIDGNTPIDKIPSNVRTLIQILKKNGVTELDDTIIQGYKLKHI